MAYRAARKGPQHQRLFAWGNARILNLKKKFCIFGPVRFSLIFQLFPHIWLKNLTRSVHTDIAVRKNKSFLCAQSYWYSCRQKRPQKILCDSPFKLRLIMRANFCFAEPSNDCTNIFADAGNLCGSAVHHCQTFLRENPARHRVCRAMGENYRIYRNLPSSLNCHLVKDHFFHKQQPFESGNYLFF